MSDTCDYCGDPLEKGLEESWVSVTLFTSVHTDEKQIQHIAEFHRGKCVEAAAKKGWQK
jgi:hypothetical protein